VVVLGPCRQRPVEYPDKAWAIEIKIWFAAESIAVASVQGVQTALKATAYTGAQRSDREVTNAWSSTHHAHMCFRVARFLTNCCIGVQ
jgi:hypothetical protein